MVHILHDSEAEGVLLYRTERSEVGPGPGAVGLHVDECFDPVDGFVVQRRDLDPESPHSLELARLSSTVPAQPLPSNAEQPGCAGSADVAKVVEVAKQAQWASSRPRPSFPQTGH